MLRMTVAVTDVGRSLSMSSLSFQTFVAVMSTSGLRVLVTVKALPLRETTDV